MNLKSCFPSARIYAFEPHGIAFERLSKALGDGFIAFNAGLGERAGIMQLYDVAYDDGGTSHASLYPAVIKDLHGADMAAVDVEIKALDDVAEELGIERIDFLKIDAEGHDLYVLKGARRLLAEQRIGAIYFEFNEMNIVSRCFMRDFTQILQSYRLFRLLPNALLELFRYISVD